MSDYSTFRKRMNRMGGNQLEARANNTKQVVNQTFGRSPSVKAVSYEGIETEAMISYEKRSNEYTQSQSDQRSFTFKPNFHAEIGGIIEMDDDIYVVYDSNESELLPVYYALKSNNHIRVKIGEEREITGYTSIGQPIYGSVKPIFFERPCYATVNARFNVYTEFDSKINAPSGRMLIFFPYSEDQDLKDGMEFNMFGDRYRIINVDITRVSNGKGITRLFTDKIQSE
ncbi:hypothetical protein PQ478_08480 [Alkalihalophilus pseudofirmus]|uniref:hypothetical protein n=1 Tax=Alkalihalophilus pseudofirmus TaxID=79885 RepID=UPI00259B73D9|nr:hypothetical protein [Alkalihalophilus pseudofirmus]WEG18504.1 hypothetical protein PQ478_08480 [Alkalihalophilus pseudofirmus]